MNNARAFVVAVVVVCGAFARGAWSAPPKKVAASTSASASVSAPATSATTASTQKSLGETLGGEAKEAFEQGVFAYKNGDFQGALVKLQHAYDLSKDPRILWNMALCEQKLRRYAAATRSFHRYLDEGGDLVTPEDRDKAQKTIEQIEPFTSTLVFTVDQPGAEVFVDDVSLGKTPLPSGDLVDVGQRKIRVHKEGFADFAQDVFVDGSKRQIPVDVKLVVEKHEGKITLRAPPGAEIFIDGARVAMGEWSGVLKSGGHTLRVTSAGMRVYQTEIVVQDHDDRTIDVPLEPEVVPDEVYDRFEADLRLGYGKFAGNDHAGLTEISGAIGVRLGRPTWLGLRYGYGRIDASNGTCGRRTNGPAPSSPFDLAPHYSFQTCLHMRGELELMVHLLPRTWIDPWLGVSAGFFFSHGEASKFQLIASSSADGGMVSGDGFVLQASPEVGVDVHPVSTFTNWAVGPFFVMHLTVAGDYKFNDESTTNLPSDPNHSKDNGDKVPFIYWMIGLRNAISF